MAGIPQRAGVNAVEAIEGVGVPALVGALNEGRIAETAQPLFWDVERPRQFVPIVDPGVRHQRDAGRARRWLAVESVFGKDPLQRAAEGDIAAVPGEHVVAAIHPQRGEHPGAFLGRIRPTIEPPHTRDGRHRNTRPSAALPGMRNRVVISPLPAGCERCGFVGSWTSARLHV